MNSVRFSRGYKQAGLLRVAACLLATLPFLAHALPSWNDVQLGGFASQGYLKSSRNDYLGSSLDGTFALREYAANASVAQGKWRVGAQVFGQKLGNYGNDRIKLDWATVDYQFGQALGLRAGRVKMPRGLYNEALDLDSVRPFVLLPQGVYDPRLRDFQASFDGAMAYGNISLRRVGSLDYRAYYGDIPIPTNGGANRYFNNGTARVLGPMKMDSVLGGSLFWNTPVQGLRTGYSFSIFKNLISRSYPSPEQIASNSSDPYTKSTEGYPRHLFSAEYVKGDWVLATEYGREHSLYFTDTLPGIAKPKYLHRPTKFTATTHYYSISRRINSRFEVGAYFDRYSDRTSTVSTKTGLTKVESLDQKDYALSVRFDATSHLLFKVEYHLYRGTGKIWDTPSGLPIEGRNTLLPGQPFVRLVDHWGMIAAKTTYTF